MPPDTEATAGLWVSISELAKLKGLTKQTVGEKVRRLESEGHLSCRDGGKGRPKLVNVAAYDRAVGETADAVRTEAAARLHDKPDDAAPAADSKAATVLSREQARLAAYRADIAQLDLDLRLGRLMEVEAVTAAMARAAEALVRRIEQMPGRADDLASAVAADGINGARLFLKQMARDFREALAQDLRLLEGEAPASSADEALE